MSKKIILTLLIIFLAPVVMAQDYTQRITPEIANGIKAYKVGNYTGCIQNIKYHYLKNPREKNQIAAYYLAMSFTQSGDKDLATVFYKDVIKMNPNNTLGQYAQKGLVCIETPEQCYTKVKVTKNESAKETELDKFINAPYGNGLSSNLNKEIERKKLEKLRKEMNSDEELNKYEFKDFKEYSPKKSQLENSIDGIKLASAKPSDAEVLNEIRVLNDAGLGNIAQYAQQKQEAKEQTTTSAQPEKKEVTSAYKPDLTREEYQQQIQREMMQAQIAAMAQPNIGALFGEKNSNQNNMMNNNMMNMLPFMMAQQAQNRQQQTISPDIMQAMMFNQMMPNLDFSSGNNDR